MCAPCSSLECEIVKLAIGPSQLFFSFAFLSHPHLSLAMVIQADPQSLMDGLGVPSSGQDAEEASPNPADVVDLSLTRFALQPALASSPSESMFLLLQSLADPTRSSLVQDTDSLFHRVLADKDNLQAQLARLQLEAQHRGNNSRKDDYRDRIQALRGEIEARKDDLLNWAEVRLARLFLPARCTSEARKRANTSLTLTTKTDCSGARQSGSNSRTQKRSFRSAKHACKSSKRPVRRSARVLKATPETSISVPWVRRSFLSCSTRESAVSIPALAKPS